MVEVEVWRQQWQQWAEKEFPGSKGQVEAAMRAVAIAVSQKRSADQIVAAAHAAAALWQQDGAPSSTRPVQPQAVYPRETPKASESYAGIYDVIAADRSELGRSTLAALEALNMQQTMRTKAFLATRGFRSGYSWDGEKGRVRHWLFTILLIVVLAIGFVVYKGGLLRSVHGGLLRSIHVGKSASFGMPMLISVLGIYIIFLVFRAWLLSSRARVDISKGRILINYGVLSTSVIANEIHWIREAGWSQTFVQKLFGEATIWLSLDTPNRGVAHLYLPGLVPVSEMQNWVDKFRNASQKIRQGNYYARSFIG
jgi:hypothetical protein